MTYWNGSAWQAEPTSLPPRPKRARRLLGAATEAGLITTLIFGLIAGTTLAAKGGGGGGIANRTVATCQIEGNVVSTTGLPTDEVVNFMVTDASGTDGWVLGVTWEGWWTLTVPARTGPTTYEFVSRTHGPNGSKYDVYSRCSALS